MLQKLTIVLSVKLRRYRLGSLGEMPFKTFATNSEFSSYKERNKIYLVLRREGIKLDWRNPQKESFLFPNGTQGNLA